MVRCTRHNDESADAHRVESSSRTSMQHAMTYGDRVRKAPGIRNLGGLAF
jgi:hypothetical protein